MTALVELMLERRSLGPIGEKWARRTFAFGLACLALAVLGALLLDSWRARFFPAYLTAYAWVLSFTLGALFFVVLQHLVHAGWSVVVRRLGEFVAAQGLWLAVLALPLLLGLGELYHWTHAEEVAKDPVLLSKKPYLNLPFFFLRLVVYYAFWSWVGKAYLDASRAQDASGDPEITLRLQKRSAPVMVAYALTVTFAAFDLLMSLNPHWYSTVFGVYYFSGGVVGFLALLISLSVLLQRSGFLRRTVTREHYHDLGKLLFAFVVFWAYIAFSQFMLIWYANIPEETSWIIRRTNGGFEIIGLILVLGHFLLPFLLLLSRGIKRAPGVLVYPALWLLLMHYLDLYWVVMPEFGGASPQLVDLLLMAALAGLFLAGVLRLASRTPLAPQKDPRLEESLAFENA
ncbi:MAG: hypothetical protein N2447_05300 [Thermoanaerobaculum sp.]|nr:hypothetical protein [Thermoanaerobaculum sp.]